MMSWEDIADEEQEKDDDVITGHYWCLLNSCILRTAGEGVLG